MKRVQKSSELSSIFDEIRRLDELEKDRRYERSKKLIDQVSTHPDLNVHLLTKFLVSSSRVFEKDVSRLVNSYWQWFLTDCTLCRLIINDKHLRSQLTVKDTIKLLSTKMGVTDDDLYSHLEKLLSSLSLRQQFLLFDRIMRLSRKWRLKRIVYQYVLIYLVQNFNIPARKKGARSLVKMTNTILEKPCICNNSLILPKDELLIALRRTIAALTR